MSRSKWFAAVLVALAVPAMPAAQAGYRTRVQITIAPSWGWGPNYRPAFGIDRRHFDGYRFDRRGGFYDGHHGGPVIRFDYRDRGGYYGYGGYRPGGHLRYDGAAAAAGATSRAMARPGACSAGPCSIVKGVRKHPAFPTCRRAPRCPRSTNSANASTKSTPA